MNKQLSLSILVAVLAIGCGGEERTSTQAAPVTSENGIWENGFTTNGIWENGIWENGIWENGIWENGIWENGIWENGIWENGIWENGIWENGIWENGIWENGIWENGIWENGIWENGWRADQLRDNEYAGALLQYIYSCAMPKYIDGDVNKSTTIVIGPVDAQVVLEGSIGVGINADNTGWWESGNCDESCQRWVSACVLARTNAYGVHVSISMRAPANAPQRIKDALATTGPEVAEFNLPEGAFYGNIFQTTPQDNTPPVGGNGPEDGIVVATPSFYACSGIGSTIPALTNRFCSSLGDDQVIDVVGLCETADPDHLGVCDVFADGAHGDCWLDADKTTEKYTEVITTYLRTPLAVCGNSICEAGETFALCPTDCNEGGWTRTFEDQIGEVGAGGKFAVGPDDEVVIVAKGGVDIDLGGGVLTDPSSAPHDIAIAKYTKDGTHVWSRRVDIMGAPSANNNAEASGVSVLPDGTVVVVGLSESSGWGFFEHRFDGVDGHTTYSATFIDGGPADVRVSGTNGELVVGADGSLYVYGRFQGPDGIELFPCSWSSGQPSASGTFIAKLENNLIPGQDCWIRGFDYSPTAPSPGQLAIGSDGNLIWKPRGDDTELLKLNSANGNTIWTVQTPAHPLRYAVEPATNDIIIAGTYDGTTPLAGSQASDLQPNQPEFFLARLAGNDGSTLWTKYATDYAKIDPTEPNAYVTIDITRVALDTTGNGVMVAGLFGQVDGGLVNFGAGNFYSYAYEDPFLLAYSLDSEFRFAKQVPLVLEGALATMAVDSRSHIVMSGDFGGSMVIDGQFVVNDDPLLTNSEQTFISSFPMPGPDDLTAPVLENKPLNFTVQATGPTGANVWYMPPTAIDPSGATVLCTPKPNALLSLGAHTINCTGTDIHGNASSTSFNVSVIDTRGPAILINADVVVEATGPTTTVAYPTPTATDQVSGATTVNCAPASGTAFPVGSNHVTCTSTDGAGNTTTSRFVTVVDTQAPTLTLPGNIATGNNVVNYATSASDIADANVPVVCDHPSGSTFPGGVTVVHCSATDDSGNTTNGSFTVTVTFTFGTFLQPINGDGSSIFKLGSTVPIKFQLAGQSAGVQTPAFLTLLKLTNNPGGTVNEAVSTSAADTGNQFRYQGGTYMFNLSTSGLSVGRWEARVDLGDGTLHTVEFALRP